jgi:hypothetical protein
MSQVSWVCLQQERAAPAALFLQSKIASLMLFRSTHAAMGKAKDLHCLKLPQKLSVSETARKDPQICARFAPEVKRKAVSVARIAPPTPSAFC